MKYEEYINMRNGLMDEANALIDNGDLEQADAKMADVKALDEKFEKISQARANAQALEDSKKVVNVQDVQTETFQFGAAVATAQEKDVIASEEYKNAWAKTMMGKQLSDKEAEAFRLVNEALTTKNTGVVIPETVAAGIWDLIAEKYTYWNDVQKTYVKGQYTAIIGDESSDAAWYDEATETADGSETFKKLTLNGCELARSITVSFKLKEMAMDEFIPYIQAKLAEKMGKALAYGATHGKGTPSSSESFKAEPLGVVTALEAEASTPQVATYTKGSLAYKDLTAAIAKIEYGAESLAIYANNQTIWTEIANVMDGNGRPLFVADPISSNGAGRILGVEIKRDDSMSDGEILISSPSAGYIANINKEISVMTEDHVKARTTDYCAYAIVDGAVITTKAHSLLKLGE